MSHGAILIAPEQIAASLAKLGIQPGVRVALGGVPKELHRAVKEAVGSRGEVVIGPPDAKSRKKPDVVWVVCEEKTQAAIRLPAYLDVLAPGGKLWVSVSKTLTSSGPSAGSRLTVMDLQRFLEMRGKTIAQQLDLGAGYVACRVGKTKRR